MMIVENMKNNKISFFNSFDSQKFKNEKVMQRYLQLVNFRFQKLYGVSVSEIRTGHHNDDFIKNKLTIIFEAYAPLPTL